MEIKHVCSEHLYHIKSYCVKQVAHKEYKIIDASRYTGHFLPVYLEGLLWKAQLWPANFALCHILKESCYSRVIRISIAIID